MYRIAAMGSSSVLAMFWILLIVRMIFWFVVIILYFVLVLFVLLFCFCKCFILMFILIFVMFEVSTRLSSVLDVSVNFVCWLWYFVKCVIIGMFFVVEVDVKDLLFMLLLLIWSILMLIKLLGIEKLVFSSTFTSYS